MKWSQVIVLLAVMQLISAHYDCTPRVKKLCSNRRFQRSQDAAFFTHLLNNPEISHLMKNQDNDADIHSRVHLRRASSPESHISLVKQHYYNEYIPSQQLHQQEILRSLRAGSFSPNIIETHMRSRNASTELEVLLERHSREAAQYGVEGIRACCKVPPEKLCPCI